MNTITTSEQSPGLFGQKHSSRDYTKAKVWGKNQFNSSFPASLLAYMKSQGVDPVYLQADKLSGCVRHSKIDPSEVFGINPLSDEAYYDFEAGYFPFNKFYTGEREKIDLVMVNLSDETPVRGLEIKLTACPDETTRHLDADLYSSEIVVRPPTVCFVACSICRHYNTRSGKERLRSFLERVPKINHWEEITDVAVHFNAIQGCICEICRDMLNAQTPMMVQPVWRSDASRSRLADECLDVFVWSDLAIIQLCITDTYVPSEGINRFNRTVVWLYQMLFEFCTFGRFDYMRIIKNHSYNAANDKAFSANGRRTFPFLKSEELRHPRIRKEEIKNIILGGGQDFLSPERRFDAVIVNTPGLFD